SGRIKMTHPNNLWVAGLALGAASLLARSAPADDSVSSPGTARLYAASPEMVSQIAPKSQPSTDPAVRALIVQLGSASPAAREEAMKKLAAMGKEVLPALQGFADSADPELRSRVRALIRRAERRLPPA